MDFELTADQLELQRTARDVLDRECPPSVARAASDADARPGDDLWAQLIALDWPALPLPEAHGGLALTWVELAIVVEELGRAVAPGPFLATLTQFAPVVAELGTPEQQSRWLGDVAAGRTRGTLALDEGSGAWSPTVVAATAKADGDVYVLSGQKRFVLDGSSADELAVAVRIDGELRVIVVPRADVSVRELSPIDGTTRHADVDLDGVRVPADRLLGAGDATAGLERALEEATLGVATTTLGACGRVFDLTVAYVKEREQFGVPVGSFQAVKHKLADMYRDVERARALCYFAALCISTDDPRRSLAASMAKAAAGECQQRAVQDGLQLFGGIGFTWENDLHLYLRRAKVGELHFGSASHHRRRIATSQLQDRARLLELGDPLP